MPDLEPTREQRTRERLTSLETRLAGQEAELNRLRRDARVPARPRSLSRRMAMGARSVALILTLFIGVPIVLASDQFADVPVGVHHDDINKLATAGITVGCGVDVNDNPLFCPGQPVSREQMATFMVRGLPRVATASWPGVRIAGVEPIATASLSIDTGVPPSATESTGFLKIDASVWVRSGADCVVRLFGTVQQNGLVVANVPSAGSAYSRNPVSGDISVSATRVVEVGSGTYAVYVNVRGHNPSDANESCSATVNGDVTALYVPFDGDANNRGP